jgi:hypothetical protein
MALKPSIPLMVTGPDSMTLDTAISAKGMGAFTIADVNGDGVEDMSVISGNGFTSALGYATESDSGYAVARRDSSEVSTPLESPLSHVFADWNNSGVYSAIVSQVGGSVLLLQACGGRFAIAETLCTAPGVRPYPVVMDVNGDGRKELVVHSEGRGVFVYVNEGPDSLPRLGRPREVLDENGRALTQFTGAPMLMDLNGTGKPSWIFCAGGLLRQFSADSGLTKLTFEGELNVAGKRFAADSVRYALKGSALGQPVIMVIKGRTLYVYATHLCGDVNGDKVVDIRDIGRISRAWETTDADAAWEPLCNLKLSGDGRELIDIRDIGKASKAWELSE